MGLSEALVEEQIELYGYNIIAENKRINPLFVVFENVKNPLTMMLVVLASISLYMDDVRNRARVGSCGLVWAALS